MKTDQQKDDEQGQHEDDLTRMQIACVWLTQLSQGVQASLPNTIAVFMVRHWEASAGHVLDEQRIARLTGLLGSFFQLAQFLTAYLWGRVSDVIGRKPVVIVGNLSCGAMIIMFGSSGSFLMASLARFLGGLFSGVIGALKTMIGESCSPNNQAKALGYLSFGWGLGSVIGPSLGGFLSDPCTNLHHALPYCGEGQLLRQRPFLLPCCVAGLISLLAAAINTICLQESLNQTSPTGFGAGWWWRRGPRGYHRLQQEEEATGLELVKLDTHNTDVLATSTLSPSDTMGSFTTHNDEQAKPHWGSDAQGTHRRGEGENVTDEVFNFDNHGSPYEWHGNKENAQPGQLMHCLSYQTPHLFAAALDADERQPHSSRRCDGHGGVEEENGIDEGTALMVSVVDGGSEDMVERGDVCDHIPWYSRWQVRFALAGYGLSALVFKFQDDISPLYASTPIDVGGLAWTPSAFAVPVSVGGLFLMSFAIVGYPRAQKRFGVSRTAQIGLVTSAVATLLPPCVYYIQAHSVQVVIMCAATGLRAICGVMAFTSSMILVNLASPKSQVGTVNGVGQTLAAGVRAGGPALAGLMWSFTIHMSFVGHQFIPFVLVSIGLLCIQFFYVKLHKDGM